VRQQMVPAQPQAVKHGLQSVRQHSAQAGVMVGFGRGEFLDEGGEGEEKAEIEPVPVGARDAGEPPNSFQPRLMSRQKLPRGPKPGAYPLQADLIPFEPTDRTPQP
jgi:hypothetical protein